MYTSRYVLKIFKKRVVHLLVRFFKAFKKKKSAYKNIQSKSYLLHHGPLFLCIFFKRIKNIQSISYLLHHESLFYASFVSLQNYLEESYLLHHGPLILCIFFKYIKNIQSKSYLLHHELLFLCIFFKRIRIPE